MLLVPNAVLIRYVAHLNKRGIDVARYAENKKWLRYYLDFCDKYPVPDARSERVWMFMEKLREKKRTEAQRKRASHAVSLYFEMLRQEGFTSNEQRMGKAAQQFPEYESLLPIPGFGPIVSAMVHAGLARYPSSGDTSCFYRLTMT